MVNGKSVDGIGVEYDLTADYAYSEDVSLYAAAAQLDVDKDSVFDNNSDDVTLLKWGVVVNF